MSLALASIVIWVTGALLCAVVGGRRRAVNVLGPTAVVAGCLPALVQAIVVLISGQPVAVSLPWSIPFGAFRLEMDPLSAIFAAPILVVSSLAAVYGGEYLRGDAGRRGWAFTGCCTFS